MCATAWSWSQVSIRVWPPQLQAVPWPVRSTALLAVVAEFSGVAKSLATASSGTPWLVLAAQSGAVQLDRSTIEKVRLKPAIAISFGHANHQLKLVADRDAG